MSPPFPALFPGTRPGSQKHLKGSTNGHKVWFSAIVALALLVFSAPAFSQSFQLLATRTLVVGPYTITAEVADTEATRAHGLSFRTSLPNDHGMLFVFPTDTETCFWMKNTPLALSIAFIDNQGTIVNVADMEPNTTTPHCPARAVRYALEMKQGWFHDKGLRSGSRVKELP